MRRPFHAQLAEAEARCLQMAGLVLAQLDRVLGALGARDEALAEQVIGGDDAVDELYLDIERRILQLLATQAPVASDLRLVTAILHINIHLERMGDLCTNIAKLVRLTKDFPASEEILAALREMGAQAGRMLDTAMKAFAARDLQAALGLAGMDEPINRLNRRIIREVAAFAHDEARLEWATRMVLASRQLERMGDHAVDIGEQVAFLVTGELREFTDASHKAEA